MKRSFWILLTFVFRTATVFSQDWKKITATSDSITFSKKINPEKYKIAGNPALEQLSQLAISNNISDSALYQQLKNWNNYPTPSKRGVICEYRLQLDSNYRVPYLVYIPKNYDPTHKTSLLIYYKGGWISRKKLPADYAKEIVTDNPTFDYLDENNSIEIFPALESKLAIYGNYGYKHLTEMIAQTKKLFNIDDNKVFLSGFSDGGKTVYLSSNLIPSAFACFYPINGSIVSPPFYPNYVNRPICSFVADKDELTDYRSILTKAAYALSLGADWQYRQLKGKKHMYFSYQNEVLPYMFENMKSKYRNPYPTSVTYQLSYNYKDFTGIDWIQMKVNTDKKTSAFHFTDSIRTFSADGEERNYRYGEKTGQLKATCFNNTYTIEASLVDEVDIYISPMMVDLNSPIKVIINGKEVFSEKLTYSKTFMVDRFNHYFDREQLWVNKITLSVP